LACLPKIFCKRRVHESNITKQSELTLQGRITVLEKNRRNFPLLVPEEAWDCELAKHYCQLGYILLQKGQRRMALQAGLTSLGLAFRQMTKKGAFSSYPWGWGICLIPSTLLGWQFSRLIFQPMKRQRTNKGISCHTSPDKNI